MLCPKCGSQNPDNANFCGRCTLSLNSNQSVRPEDQHSYVKPKKPFYKKWWVWLIVAVVLIGIFNPSNSSREERSRDNIPPKSDTGITELRFSTLSESLELEVGGNRKSWFGVSGNRDFKLDDIEFISTNDDVATFEYDDTALTTCIYFYITGVSPGEATIYAQTKDGIVKTEEITVIVTGDPVTTTSKPTTTAPEETTTKKRKTTTAAPEPTNPPVVDPPAEDPPPSEDQGYIVYWVPGGQVYHSTTGCRSLARSSDIRSGTLQDAINAGKDRPCKNCH